MPIRKTPKVARSGKNVLVVKETDGTKYKSKFRGRVAKEKIIDPDGTTNKTKIKLGKDGKVKKIKYSGPRSHADQIDVVGGLAKLAQDKQKREKRQKLMLKKQKPKKKSAPASNMKPYEAKKSDFKRRG
jgi:hypothetical protein